MKVDEETAAKAVIVQTLASGGLINFEQVADAIVSDLAREGHSIVKSYCPRCSDHVDQHWCADLEDTYEGA